MTRATGTIRPAAPDHRADEPRIAGFQLPVDPVEPAVEDVRFSGGPRVAATCAHWVGFSVTALMALISAVAAMTRANLPVQLSDDARQERGRQEHRTSAPG